MGHSPEEVAAIKSLIREALVKEIPNCPWPYFDPDELIHRYSFLIDDVLDRTKQELPPEYFVEVILIRATLP